MFKGLRSLFGFASKADDANDANSPSVSTRAEATHSDSRPRVARARTEIDAQPVLQDAGFSGLGGIQGLSWYTRTLQMDEAGDVAHGFYLEGAPTPGSAPLPDRFQIGLVADGNVVLVT